MVVTSSHHSLLLLGAQVYAGSKTGHHGSDVFRDHCHTGYAGVPEFSSLGIGRGGSSKWGWRGGGEVSLYPKQASSATTTSHGFQNHLMKQWRWPEEKQGNPHHPSLTGCNVERKWSWFGLHRGVRPGKKVDGCSVPPANTAA